MKSSSYVDHVTVVMPPVCVYLVLLIVMASGHPSCHFRSLYVPDDNRDYYSSIDFDEPVPFAVNKPVQVIEKKFTIDGTTDEVTRSAGINLKKKNSEIISVLMGLRKAMSQQYNERLQGIQ